MKVFTELWISSVENFQGRRKGENRLILTSNICAQDIESSVQNNLEPVH